MTVLGGCAAAERSRAGRLRGIGPSCRDHHPIIAPDEPAPTGHRAPGRGSAHGSGLYLVAFVVALVLGWTMPAVVLAVIGILLTLLGLWNPDPTRRRRAG